MPILQCNSRTYLNPNSRASKTLNPLFPVFRRRSWRGFGSGLRSSWRIDGIAKSSRIRLRARLDAAIKRADDHYAAGRCSPLWPDDLAG